MTTNICLRCQPASIYSSWLFYRLQCVIFLREGTKLIVGIALLANMHNNRLGTILKLKSPEKMLTKSRVRKNWVQADSPRVV